MTAKHRGVPDAAPVPDAPGTAPHPTLRSERYAPGSYCLGTCYCGEHPHYKPSPVLTEVPDALKRKRPPVKDRLE